MNAREHHMRIPCLVLLSILSVAAAEPDAVLVAAPAAAPAIADASAAFLAALAQAPQVRALIARQQAQHYLETSAGRLPDPMLNLGFARKRMPMETRPMYDLSLEQPLPRWGERDAARSLAASATRQSEADIAALIGQLASDVASALAECDGLTARLHEGEAEELRIAALGRAIDAKVASGDAGALQRLGIETRRERLHLRLEDVRRALADRLAEVRGRLALTPTAALPPFAAPQPDAIDPARSPLALAAEADRLSALAMMQEARSQGRPATAIGVRAEHEVGDAGNEDTIGVTVSISLPIARAAIAANEDAAHARVRAAEQAAEAARWRTQTAVANVQRAVAQAARADQLAGGLLARAEAEQQTLTAGLGSGGAELAALLDLYDRLAELRLDVIDARVAAQMAQAGLWAHTIPALPAPTTVTP